jgi:ubiquinone/menaquinone biosynthesis C-methylase UbiE
MLMLPFLRRGDPHMLTISMTGVKLADRVAQVGCADGRRLGAVAAKVGLSGRFVAIVPDEASAARARKGAADEGALIEIEVAPPTRLLAEQAVFDLVVVDDTGGLMAKMSADDRTAAIREVFRILRKGGRVMVIGSAPRGIGALFTRERQTARFDPLPSLEADGFKSVRTLADRDGLVFVEGMKPRT